MMETPHGTRKGYLDYGCRCDDCRQAEHAYRQSLRQRGLPLDDPRHGTENGYNHYGCRCDLCRTAGVAAVIARRQRSGRLS